MKWTVELRDTNNSCNFFFQDYALLQILNKCISINFR